MIVLDANVLIGLLDANDVHHRRAVELLDEHAADGFAASALTVAEALVGPARTGAEERASANFAAFGLTVLSLHASEAASLARVRAHHRMRMPDAVVLHTAIEHRGALATFDASLAKAARDSGVVVVD